MFWQFETGFVSQIDTLLDKENVPLKELMEEEDILQECKSQNPKLIRFLTLPSILEEMVNMITTEPPMEANETNRYKYANIASEIMTSDVNDIIEALVSDESLLTKIYNFVDTEQQLNPLLASFFSKLMGLLFIKKTALIFEFLKSKDFLSLLLTHIETSAIMDLILKLIVSVENLDLRKTIITWLFENDLIGKLLDVFKTDGSPQRHTNVALLICDVIKTTREQLSILRDKLDSDLLLDSLESTETVSHLLDNIFTSRTESSLVSGLSIIQSLLEYKRHCMNNNIQTLSNPQTPVQHSAEFEAMPQCYTQQTGAMSDVISCEQLNPLDSEKLAKSVRQVQAAILPRLEDFSLLLEQPPKRDPIRTTIGLIQKPLGATRLEVAHLITALLSSNNSEISDKLVQMNTLPTLINLFFEYPWNNFLHKHIEQTITCILTNNKSNSSNGLNCENTSSNGECSALVIKLLTECQLIDRMIEAFDSYNSKIENNETKAKPIRPGYLGHLIIIANLIKDKCDPQLLKQHLTLDTYDKWIAFVDKILEPTNKIICTPLVKEMPHSHNMDEESLRNQESVLQQAFLEYQMQQMTRNLCTQIAFAANEFTEVNESIPNQINSLSRVNFNFENQLQQKDKSLEFEKMCSERAKTSLDSNSSDDEDLWEDRDLSFTQSAPKVENKKISLISDESAVFPEHSFDYNSSHQMNKLTSMDVDHNDHNDPWTSEPVHCSSTAAVPMDTSNPWEALSSNKGENSCLTNTNNSNPAIEADSWADFSSFPSTEFSSSLMTTTSMNTGVSTSDIPSSEEPTIGSGVAESTTQEETGLTSQVASSLNTSSDTNFASFEMAFTKNVTDEQENVVTSSTSDSLQNGPNS